MKLIDFINLILKHLILLIVVPLLLAAMVIALWTLHLSILHRLFYTGLAGFIDRNGQDIQLSSYKYSFWLN
jgi:hypothetical protein